MSAQAMRRCDRETALLAGLAACLSILAFLIYFRRGEVLLYGDAVAHINIARRVFDSRTPGLLQLGTVWLPLPHLLLIPVLLSDWAWRTGVGGSNPSMVAYVLGAIGTFRLTRNVLGFHSQPNIWKRVSAWGAALIFAANPNLIYLQTTAMTEPLYLALFIWAIVHFSEFTQQTAAPDQTQPTAASSSLLKCGWCVAGACLTRYDGWLLGAALCVAALMVKRTDNRTLSSGWLRFILLAAAVPAFWLAYNGVLYRNPLEFANGPYSAKAIEQKTSVAGYPPHPGTHDLPVAAAYFFKSAELNLAKGDWGRTWVLLALVGTLSAFYPKRLLLAGRAAQPMGHSIWTALLLWVPVPFYALSIAYGSVPLFVPAWWPFSHYNVRYGLQLLPAFAVFTSLAAYFLTSLGRSTKFRIGVVTTAALFVVVTYASIWRDPVCFREAWINSRTRIALESKLAVKLIGLPSGSTLLMYSGDHVGALQQAGIPLRRMINEGNHRTWKQPSDPEGLWERALANPERYVDFVIAMDGDAVSRNVSKENLSPITVIDVPGQPRATVYRTFPANGNHPR